MYGTPVEDIVYENNQALQQLQSNVIQLINAMHLFYKDQPQYHQPSFIDLTSQPTEPIDLHNRHHLKMCGSNLVLCLLILLQTELLHLLHCSTIMFPVHQLH